MAPEGWRQCRLHDIATILMGTSPPGDSYNSAGAGEPLLNGPTEFGRRHPSPTQWTTAPTKVCEAGDILFCVRGATTGRQNLADRRYCIGRGLAAIRGQGRQSVTGFLRHLLQSISADILKEATGAGSTFPNVNHERLSEWQVQVPPLGEQRKIAAILSSVDEAIEKTDAVIAQLDVVKKAMLEALVTRGIPGQHSRFKQTDVGEVPEEWSVDRLGRLLGAGPTNGLYKPQSDYGSGTPIVRIDAFDHGDRIGIGGLQRVRATPEELSRFSITNGDILLNRVNSITHIGKCCLIDGAGEGAVFESNMMRLRADTKAVSNEFLFIVLTSNRTRKHFRGCAKQAVAQASINQQDLGSLLVALPNRSEQAEVAEIMKGIGSAIQAERTYLRNLKLSKDALAAALLSGDLRAGGA